MGFSAELADAGMVIGEGPVPDGVPGRDRYDRAVAELEAFVADGCDLDPEVVDALVR